MAAVRIRDAIRERMAERGHTLRQAAIAMGIDYSLLWRFMNAQTVEFGRPNCARVAGYLGITSGVARRWIKRDGGWIRARRERGERSTKSKGLVTGGGEVMTWWGWVAAEPRVTKVPWRKCGECPMCTECRRSVAAGGPLLCERFLERELVPDQALGAHAGAPLQG